MAEDGSVTLNLRKYGDLSHLISHSMDYGNQLTTQIIGNRLTQEGTNLTKFKGI